MPYKYNKTLIKALLPCAIYHINIIKQSRPCYHQQFSQQLTSQSHCETSCRIIAQYNMGCLAIFVVARSVARISITQLYFRQRIAATGNTNICTVHHLSSNFSRNFASVLTRAHAYTSRFSFRGALGTQVPSPSPA